jgi:hypothetical protein
VVDNDSSNDQWWLVWGIQSRYYSADASAALAWQAEALTAMGGSVIAVGPSGASATNVKRAENIGTSYQAILSTQAVGGGSHMSHVGSFRVFARVQTPTTNTGTVSVALEWGEGDYRRYSQNDTATITTSEGGTWRLLDLGLVSLTTVVAGTQRWEGRMLAKSTVAGDDIDVDWLMLVPVDEGAGEAKALWRIPTATAFSAQDGFNQSAGALTGKTASTGGVWAGAGDADDFSVETTGQTAQRTAINDAGDWFGRYAVSGASALTATAVQADFKAADLDAGAEQGVFARYSSTTSWAMAVFDRDSDGDWLKFYYYTGGSATFLAEASFPRANGAFYTLRLLIDTAGKFAVWAAQTGSAFGDPLITGQSSVFATAGALASGSVGFYDEQTGGAANTRNVDNFIAWQPSTDASVFANQSLEIRHDRAVREDSAGTLWGTPSSYVGDYLQVPPAGAEGRTSRVIVKASRGGPGSTDPADSGTDDISASLRVTPRYLAVPES